MRQNELICPTDGTKINESKVRVVAFEVLLIALAYGLTQALVLPLLLVVDFGLRSFNLPAYSPLARVADSVVRGLKLPTKLVDGAPKRFAARIGLAFALLITGLHLVGISALVPTAVLALFATLESLAGFCAGCLVYTYYLRFRANLIQ